MWTEADVDPLVFVENHLPESLSSQFYFKSDPTGGLSTANFSSIPNVKGEDAAVTPVGLTIKNRPNFNRSSAACRHFPALQFARWDVHVPCRGLERSALPTPT